MIKLRRLTSLLKQPRGNPLVARAFMAEWFRRNTQLKILQDTYGNFYLQTHKDVTSAFVAHYDTVDKPDHQLGQKKKLQLVKGRISLAHSQPFVCLGADDSAGVELLLTIAEAHVPGLYVWAADEETGCKGTRKFLKNPPVPLANIRRCISLDRRGTTSVITEQIGIQTASTGFAQALCNGLRMKHMPDPHGCFTDSLIWAEKFPTMECTNISVGYEDAHSPTENLDISYLQKLATRLIGVPWEHLPNERMETRDSIRLLEDAIQRYPTIAAELIRDYGIDQYFLEEVEKFEAKRRHEAAKVHHMRGCTTDNQTQDSMHFLWDTTGRLW